MKYYSAINMNEMVVHVTTWMSSEILFMCLFGGVARMRGGAEREEEEGGK